MANTNTVCSMCGDIGFADKLFQCIRCHSRLQHSYCTNYYDEATSETVGVCDWCLSEERSGAKRGIHSKRLARKDSAETGSGYKAEHNSDREESQSRGKSDSAGGASSKPTGRRYKLLKDVLC
ncbi:unnamed protein product [Musa acuminata subsp. burmannicoides]|uniref:(wild Malaysian banana) hypothetical protein n=1 Tax=Musa acuminata subsp. malaccensis TaxID=214687 RepID=A0A804J4P9_MUSAM|nr:PREDICTED: uncharacterized protein LOC103985019 [Musa acuminata subsp. malaccensis]CAG1838564.1 unnamed protein product [Musa acuminata subsp. malaccensis]